MSHSRPCRVLIVDDNVASAKTLGWMAEREDREIRMCHDGVVAIKICDEFKPDIIFLDLGMRGMNGIEVCQILRRDYAAVDMLIVAQTGWGDDRTRQKTSEAGFDDHLVKPIRPDIFESTIAAVERRIARIAVEQLSLPSSAAPPKSQLCLG